MLEIESFPEGEKWQFKNEFDCLKFIMQECIPDSINKAKPIYEIYVFNEITTKMKDIFKLLDGENWNEMFDYLDEDDLEAMEEHNKIWEAIKKLDD